MPFVSIGKQYCHMCDEETYQTNQSLEWHELLVDRHNEHSPWVCDSCYYEYLDVKEFQNR